MTHEQEPMVHSLERFIVDCAEVIAVHLARPYNEEDVCGSDELYSLITSGIGPNLHFWDGCVCYFSDDPDEGFVWLKRGAHGDAHGL